MTLGTTSNAFVQFFWMQFCILVGYLSSKRNIWQDSTPFRRNVPGKNVPDVHQNNGPLIEVCKLCNFVETFHVLEKWIFSTTNKRCITWALCTKMQFLVWKVPQSDPKVVEYIKIFKNSYVSDAFIQLFCNSFEQVRVIQYVTVPSETAKLVDIGILDLNMFRKFLKILIRCLTWHWACDCSFRCFNEISRYFDNKSEDREKT